MFTFVTCNADLNLQLRKTLKYPQFPAICPFIDFRNQPEALWRFPIGCGPHFKNHFSQLSQKYGRMPRNWYLTTMEIYLLEILQVKTTLGSQFPLHYLALDESFTSTLEIHIQRQRHFNIHVNFIYLKITAKECAADIDPWRHLVCLCPVLAVPIIMSASSGHT